MLTADRENWALINASPALPQQILIKGADVAFFDGTLFREPIGTIATARDSWSRMMPLQRLRARGQRQAHASALPRPPAEMLLVAATEQLGPPPPDAPTPSAAGSRSARASRKTRYRAGLRADRARDSSAPTRFSLLPLAARTQWPADLGRISQWLAALRDFDPGPRSDRVIFDQVQRGLPIGPFRLAPRANIPPAPVL